MIKFRDIRMEWKLIVLFLLVELIPFVFTGGQNLRAARNATVSVDEYRRKSVLDFLE